MRPFWHTLQRGLIPLTLLGVMMTACQSASSETMQATATAYAQNSILAAQQMAEDATLALCRMDLEHGSEIYTQQVCEVATEIGCRMLSVEIAKQWESLQERFQPQFLDCEISEIDFVEEGEQFNQVMQVWWIKTKGTQGWIEEAETHDYFLQLVLENDQWKLNRVLPEFEARYYLAQFSAQ